MLKLNFYPWSKKRKWDKDHDDWFSVGKCAKFCSQRIGIYCQKEYGFAM